MGYRYKVSVILPVYNAGKYLVKCLDSLVNQTLDGMQIIAVLDCPTDGSDLTVKKYAQSHKNIIVVENTTNLHVGGGRNVALDKAEGKYVGFFDHDDYCEPTMYEHLYSLAEETKADMVFSPFVAVDEYGKRIKNSSYPEGASVKDLYKTSVGLTLCDTIAYSKTSCPKTIWNKLYRNEIIQTHHIRFIDTRKAAPEDTPFNIEYMYYCKNIAITSSELYYHVFHSHNTGNSAEYKSMKKYALSLQAIHDFLSQKDEMEHEDIKERLDNTIRMNILVTFMNEVEKLGIGRAIKDCFYVNKNHPFIADAYEHTSRIMYPGGQSSKRNALSFVLSRIFK